jgi:hypothetical protein
MDLQITCHRNVMVCLEDQEDAKGFTTKGEFVGYVGNVLVFTCNHHFDDCPCSTLILLRLLS